MFGNKTDHSVGFETVRDAEIKAIREDRDALLPERKNSQKIAGLALSGGGVRAAAFSLGVMQGLCSQNEDKAPSDKTLFDELDYMSTVSGGGYAGAAVTWFRHLSQSTPNVQDLEYFKDKVIQNGKSDAAIEQEALSEIDAYRTPLREFPGRFGNVKTAIDDAVNYIRYRKNHLTPTFFLNFLSMAAVAFRTTLLSLPIFLAVLVVLFVVFGWVAGAAIDPLREWPLVGQVISSYEAVIGEATQCEYKSGEKYKFLCESPAILAFLLVAGLVTVFLLLSVRLLIASRGGPHGAGHYNFRRNSQRRIGVVVAGIFAFAAMWIAMVLEGIVENYEGGLLAIISVIVAGNGVGALSFGSLLGGGKAITQKRAKIIIIVVALLLLIGNLAAAHEIAEYLLRGAEYFPKDSELQHKKLPSTLEEWGPWLVLLSLALFAAAGFWANLNYVSLNRMYRDRLMEAFMPDLRSIHKQTIGNKALGADAGFMSEMNQRPYHIVNTHVVLTGSLQAKERGRTGDSFLLSPFFCGSRATGYKETKKFGIPAAKDGKGGMTLATATAISGAAFNPRVGPGGWDTPINNPIVFSMLSYYNLRLGCWVANPCHETDNTEPRPKFYYEGLKGLLNAGFHEGARMVELTDGGHFENTGLYELLQRRADIIVLSDATADGGFNFKDLGIAIERARVDLGVDIRFKWADWDLTHLMPKSQNEEHYDKRYELARRGFGIAEITYPNQKPAADPHVVGGPPGGEKAKSGYLFYVKAVMTRGLPGDLYGYRGAHKEFPYQPITDQMFDESQFEAYRELGYRLTKKMCDEFGEEISKFLIDKKPNRLTGVKEL